MNSLFDLVTGPGRVDAHQGSGRGAPPEETHQLEPASFGGGLIEQKLKLHARIIDEFNLILLEKLPPAELIKQVHSYVADYVRAENISLNQMELQEFSDEILDEMTGFGPLEPLLKDPTVTDILINTHRNCFVERN